MQEQEENIKFMQLDEDYDMIDELKRRSDEILKINHDICQLNELFTDLNSIVKDQQIGLDQIDVNIVSTKSNVEQAHKELVLAEQYQKSYYGKLASFGFAIASIAAILVIGLKK
jgi:syntaxin 12/13